MKYRDRVVKLVRVRASKLRPNPWNWRMHPDKQKAVMQGILGEVGIAGAVIARELDDGTYALIDGHLRREEYGDQKVPVIVVDLDEDEAKKLLAAHDAVGMLAETDKNKLAELVKEMKVSNKPLASLFSDMTKGSFDPNKLELDIDKDDNEDDVEEIDFANVQASHVRMVQLFLNTKTIVEFEDMIATLGPKYKTDNMTDCVMEALRRCCHEKKNTNGKVKDRTTR